MNHSGNQPTEEAIRSSRLRWVLPVAVGLATLVVFSPAMLGGFVNWDDDVNIVQNPHFRGLGAAHLAWMFTTFLGGHYQPLTWLSFGVDHQLWGLNPRGYHLTNVVLHALAAVLFFGVCAKLLAGLLDRWGRVDGDGESAAGVSATAVWWCAALAAVLFAVHPLRVESVAWVTERRDVLSGVFLVACVWAYLRAVGGERWSAGWFVVACALYGVSLLSKAAGMTLPLVLLVLDGYPLRRRARGVSWTQLLGEKVAFGVLAIPAAILAALAQRDAGAWRSLGEIGLGDRIWTVCRGMGFYVSKSLKPTGLSPLYPHEVPDAYASWAFLLPVVGVAAAAVGLWLLRKRWLGVGVAGLCFVLLLAPVSGVAQSGKQLMADRYSYLSTLPFFVLAGGGMLWSWRRAAVDAAWRRRARFLGLLGGVYVCGLVLLTLAQVGVWRGSVSLWRQALAVDPTNSVAHVNLAEGLRQGGALEEALAHAEQAVGFDADDAKAHNMLGLALMDLRRPAVALEAFETAVRLAPDNPRYRCNLGYLLAGAGRLERAADQYREALISEPRVASASKMLAGILVRLEAYAEARDVLETGLGHQPGSRVLAADLAWLLATCPDEGVRDAARAVDLAQKVCVATEFRDPWALETLAVAHAAAGDFREAAGTAERAYEVAVGAKEPALAQRLAVRIKSYRAGEPVEE